MEKILYDINPFNGKLIKEVKVSSIDEIHSMIEKARSAYLTFKNI